jgi:mannosyltransferase OCH1-like enzyme
MKVVLTFLFLLLSIFVITNEARAEYVYKSFKESMGIRRSNSKEYKLFRTIYESRNPTKLEKSQKILIPKIIHQIWLGPKQIPEIYLEFSKSWKDLHPDWRYKLWTDKDVERWDFHNKDLYNKALSYQERADILRYEILQRYGGLYVDFDMKALKNFDDLHQYYVFYVGIENDAVTNGIIGSAPNNPIFSETMRGIRKHQDMIDENKYKKLLNLAVDRCMTPFNQAVYNNIIDIDRSIVFPETYLTVGYKDQGFYKLVHISGFDNLFKKIKPHRYIHDETMSFQLIGENDRSLVRPK